MIKRLLFIPILLLCSNAFAALAITDFNQDTGVITCTDAGTRTDNNAGASMLSVFDNFETGNLDDNFTVDTPNTKYAVESSGSENDNNSTYCIRRELDGTNGSLEHPDTDSSDGYFFSMNLKMDENFTVDSAQAQMKIMRIYTGDGDDFPYPNFTVGKHEFYRLPEDYRPSRNHLIVVERSSSDVEQDTDSNPTLYDDGEWHHVMAWLKPASAVDTADGAMRLWLDGSKVAEDTAIYTDEIGGGNNNWNGTWEVLGYYYKMLNDAWVDNLCMDYSEKQVFIGNSAVFADCDKIYIQDPQSWSATSITVDFDAYGFDAGNTAYMFLLVDGAVSSGHAIEIGGGSSSDHAKLSGGISLSGGVTIS